MEAIPLSEAAKILGLSEHTLKSRIVRDKTLQGVKIPGKRKGASVWAITKEKLAELILDPKANKNDYNSLMSQWEADQLSGYITGKNLKESTVTQNLSYVRSFWSALGEPPTISKITPDNIRRAIANTDKKQYAKKENIYKGMMSLYRYMVLKGLRNEADLVQFKRFKPPKNKNPRRTFVSNEQVQTLLSLNEAWLYNRTKYDRALMAIFIHIAYETGMRSSEVCHFTFDDLNLKERTLHVRETKSGYNRLLGISEGLYDAITLYLAQRPGHPNNCVLVQRNGLSCHHRIFSKRMRMLRKKAGFDITPHGFRRSLTTELLLEGHPVAKVQKITGHRDIGTLQLYDMSTSRDAIALLQNRNQPVKQEKKKPKLFL